MYCIHEYTIIFTSPIVAFVNKKIHDYHRTLVKFFLDDNLSRAVFMLVYSFQCMLVTLYLVDKRYGPYLMNAVSRRTFEDSRDLNSAMSL